MIDPVVRPKSLLLCGLGGAGKSKVLKMIEDALSGCCGMLCGMLAEGSLTRRSNKSMTADIA